MKAESQTPLNLPPPTTVHFPVDEQHGYTLRFICGDHIDRTPRSPFADYDSPVAIDIERITAAYGEPRIERYDLAFVDRILARIDPPKNSNYDLPKEPRPEIYAMLEAHGFRVPSVFRIRSLMPVGIPAMPDSEVMAAFKQTIAEANLNTRLRSQPFLEGKKNVEVVRFMNGVAPYMIGRDAHFASEVREFKDAALLSGLSPFKPVEVLMHEGVHFVKVTVPLGALAQPETLNHRYDPPSAAFKRGDKVTLVECAANSNLAGQTGVVVGYATEDSVMRGASFANPGIGVCYDGDSDSAVDYFQPEELALLPVQQAAKASAAILPNEVSSVQRAKTPRV